MVPNHDAQEQQRSLIEVECEYLKAWRRGVITLLQLNGRVSSVGLTFRFRGDNIAHGRWQSRLLIAYLHDEGDMTSRYREWSPIIHSRSGSTTSDPGILRLDSRAYECTVLRPRRMHVGQRLAPIA